MPPSIAKVVPQAFCLPEVGPTFVQVQVWRCQVSQLEIATSAQLLSDAIASYEVAALEAFPAESSKTGPRCE